MRKRRKRMQRPNPGELLKFLLTSADIAMDGGTPLLLETGRIKVKQCAAQLRADDNNQGERRSLVHARDIDVALATSDIHADFPTLLGLMHSAGLLELPPAGTSGRRDSIGFYVDAVLNATWLPHRTYLFVVGDLVDGRRHGIGENTDPTGSFELLVHALLFNARILARQKGSDVVVTLGNHDATSVYDTHSTFLDNYVHSNAWVYWKRYTGRNVSSAKLLAAMPAPTGCPKCSKCANLSAADRKKMNIREMRCKVLAPFYDCSPFLVFSIVDRPGGRDEVSFVHGAFHADNGDRVLRPGQLLPTTDMRAAAQTIARDAGSLASHIPPVVERALNSRHYQDEAGVCKGDGVDATLIVVGHCATPLLKDPGMRVGCEAGHSSCVILRYKDGANARCAKIIALVDTGMSGCMRLATGDTQRHPPVIHMLKLTRIDFGTARVDAANNCLLMMEQMQVDNAELYAHTVKPARFGAELQTARNTCATNVPPVPARGSPHALRTGSFVISRVLVDTSLAPGPTRHVCTHGTPAVRGRNGEFLACTACNEELRHWLH